MKGGQRHHNWNCARCLPSPPPPLGAPYTPPSSLTLVGASYVFPSIRRLIALGADTLWLRCAHLTSLRTSAAASRRPLASLSPLTRRNALHHCAGAACCPASPASSPTMMCVPPPHCADAACCPASPGSSPTMMCVPPPHCAGAACCPASPGSLRDKPRGGGRAAGLA